MKELQKQISIGNEVADTDRKSDYEKRCFLAENMAQCIDSIWARSATKEGRDLAEKGLQLLLDYSMQYLRGEEDAAKAVNEGACNSEQAKSLCKADWLYNLSRPLTEQCGIDPGHAMFLLLPPVYQMIAKKQRDKKDSLAGLVHKLEQMIYPSAVSSQDIKKQLDFIYRVLGLEVPEFIGEEAIRAIVDEIHREGVAGAPCVLSADDLYEIYIQAFCMEKDENGYLKETESYREMRDRQHFVKGLQELTLETLLLTQKFLDEHKLTFFLGEGTMLGAVRHHGFIPWDDDVDILMPRDDYERLVKLAEEGKIPPELNFDALENNDKHWVLGAKMQLVRETNYIQEKVIPLSKCHGPYVDIFPLDYWPKENSIGQRLADLNVKLCRRLLFMKTGYSKGTNKSLIRMMLRVFILFVTNRQIENHAMRNMKKYRQKEHNYMVNLCSYYPYYKQVFPKECYQESIWIPFEGYKMPIPKEYDRILKKIYGKKYDSIPPYTVTAMRQHAFTLKK
jgi:lipopolysaccharide cholinephosphotransferase